MATVYDIIKGIGQAAANAYDGSHDEKYAYDKTSRKIGLKREEGDPILDSRLMDGFSVRFHGGNMILNYHSEFKIKDAHKNEFENDVNDTMAKIISYLKKEYKKLTGDSVTISPTGDAKILVQSMSRIRCWLEATREYKVGGLDKNTDKVLAGTAEDRLSDAVKKWLSLGKNK
tara:strand:- start:2496 stop:3014 length:519 start_codon:yes stop_codon:yes gene_type:complete